MHSRDFVLRLAAFAVTFALLCLSPLRASTIWYVKPTGAPTSSGLSWAAAFPNVEYAVAAAAAGDEIWVQQGLYFPLNNGGIVISKSLSIYGGFNGTESNHTHRLGSFRRTILDGDLGVAGVGTDNAYHVVSIQGVAGSGGNPGVLIDGFQIRNGDSSGGGVNGAGINCEASDLDLFNCYLKDNYAAPVQNSFGGGLYFSSAIGGAYPTSGASRLRMKICEFEHNTGWSGGGLYGDWLVGVIQNTRFIDNVSTYFGGGAYLTGMGSTRHLDFVNCTFDSNLASGSSGAGGSPLTYQGGGLCLRDNAASVGGNAGVVNCTFAGNDANSQGVGGTTPGMAVAVSPNSLATITNTIVYWNNFLGGTNPLPIAGSPTVTFSDVEGWTGGSGNINSDPLFTNLAGGNLSLASNSPCLDAADDGALLNDDLDLDGDTVTAEILPLDFLLQARLVDQSGVTDSGTGTYGYLDMGAYERP
jgi:hypothetical protein